MLHGCLLKAAASINLVSIYRSSGTIIGHMVPELGFSYADGEIPDAKNEGTILMVSVFPVLPEPAT